uniref:SSD domain-containing protein n=1 Tax=Heterorhabditis bacteriophora TaxID=37862 RepID=A0A1I7X8Z1_HETBA
MIIGAIGSPTLATFACFAIIGWASVPFNSIMCITPFLVLGIVLLDFAFEFLIFVPIMVIFYEEKEQKSPTIVKEKYNFSWERYTSYLLSPFGKTLVIGLTCTLYISAYVGVNKLIPTFDPSKTFPSDSDLLVSLRKFEKIQSEYSPLNFISRLPDITNSTELEDFFEMVGRLENRSSCYGPERTQLMLREYLEWEANLNRSLSYDDIPEFLNDRKIADKNIIQYRENNGTIVMTKINYIIICRGDLDWNRRAFEIDTTRKIIDEYPQFDISLFDYDSTIYDLIITVKHELVKAVLITFVCMTICPSEFLNFGTNDSCIESRQSARAKRVFQANVPLLKFVEPSPALSHIINIIAIHF